MAETWKCSGLMWSGGWRDVQTTLVGHVLRVKFTGAWNTWRGYIDGEPVTTVESPSGNGRELCMRKLKKLARALPPPKCCPTCRRPFPKARRR